MYKLKQRKNVIYARTLSSLQKNGLATQIEQVKQFCGNNNIPISEIASDYGNGFFFQRKNWVNLLMAVSMSKIGKIVVARQDCFVPKWFPFKYSFFEKFCSCFGTEIIALDKIEYLL